jgi:hypothetical protein
MQNEMPDIGNIFTAANYQLDNNAVELVNRCISLILYRNGWYRTHKPATP